MSKPCSIMFEELWQSGEVPTDGKMGLVGHWLSLRQWQALCRHCQNLCYSVLEAVCRGDNKMGISINGNTVQT